MQCIFIAIALVTMLVFIIDTVGDWINDKEAVGAEDGLDHTESEINEENITGQIEELEFELTEDGTAYIVTGIGTCTDTAIAIPSVYNGMPVTSIGAHAFSGTGLISITIPDSVINIGTRAFYDCTRLTIIAIPNSVKRIGDYAFFHCTSLTSITIPDSVKIIRYHTFDRCTRLTSITIPDSVTFIYKNVFDGCKNLKDVYYAGTEAEWNAITIDLGNSYLTDATIHYNSKN